MDRRRIFLVVAVIVALMGTALVFLYVRGADQRAESRFETVEVLRVTQAIEAGESIDDAAAAGKIAMQPVVRDYLQSGYQTSLEALTGQYATVKIYPGEQVVEGKFDTEAAAADSALPIKEDESAVSVNLTDPARVAGFVNPGSEVAIYYSAQGDNGPFTRLLLERVTVIGVGSTTPAPAATATTTAEGEAAPEALPRTLLTLSLDQKSSEKVIFAQGNGELSFGLLTEDSKISASNGTTSANLFE